MDGIGLDERLAGLIVAFALDALNLCQQLCKQGAQLHIVLDDKVGFAVFDLLDNHLVLGAFLVAPFGHELAVLHVRLRVGPAQLHAGELHHEAVADVIGIFRLVGLRIRHNAQFHHLGIGRIIQAEEVCAGFFQGRCIFAHGGGAHARKQLPGGMAQALVQVRMDFVRNGAPFLGQLNLLFIIREFRQGAGGQLLRGIVVRMGDIGDGDALGAVLLANPVCVGEVDADGRGRIAVAGEANGVDHLGADALDRSFLEARVHRRVVLEPLGVGAQDFRALGSLEVLDIHIAFPGSLAAQRVIVVFDEAVDEVHRADGVLHPFNVKLVPFAEVTGLVILDENAQGAFLDVVLRYLAGFAQLFADFLQGGGVQAANLPGKFHDFPGLVLDHLGVEAPGNGLGIRRVHNAGVVVFHFLARDAFIVVHGGKFYQVSGGFRGAALRPYGRVVDNVQEAVVLDAAGVQEGGEVFL